MCEKTYKRETGLKSHMKKVHGLEDVTGLDGLNESEFDPAATSTADEVGIKEEIEEGGSKGKKRTRSSSDEEEVENAESARKAKEYRLVAKEQRQLEMDLHMGYDDLLEDLNGVAGGPSTQTINENIAQTLQEAEKTITEDPGNSIFSQNTSDLTSGRDQAIMDMDKELATIKKVLANKESESIDLRVKISEANDQLDAKDRVIKDMREVIKIKNGEINDLEKEAKEFNMRLKKSPLKEELKRNSLKAEAKIRQQAEDIKMLKARVKAETNSFKPQVEKLKKQVQDQLTRAEHYTREELRHLNTIASLRKKIPCGELPGCDQGKKCGYSHVLKYAKQEVDKFKQIPCVHYMNGRCKFENEADCRYAHPKVAKDGTIELDDDIVFKTDTGIQDSVVSARSESVQEIYNDSGSFSRMANSNRPSSSGQYSAHGSRGSGSSSKPPAKRYRLVEDYSSGNSCATDKFPTPVPAVRDVRGRNRSEPRYNASNNNGKVSGNGRGSQGKGSPLMTQNPRRGSRGTSRSSRGQYRSPRPSYREREEDRRVSRDRYSVAKTKRRDSRGDARDHW